MKWRYATHQVTGDVAAAMDFVSRVHPDWDVVGIQQLTSKNPDVTVIAYREPLDGAAPAGNFANGPSNGPAPMEPLSSPMAVLKRFWATLTEQQIDAKVQGMSKADYEMLPGPVREKMYERTAYFQANDTNFKSPPWYEGNATHPFYPPKK